MMGAPMRLILLLSVLVAIGCTLSTVFDVDGGADDEGDGDADSDVDSDTDGDGDFDSGGDGAIQDEDMCTPSCDGRECGPDRCEGSCGSCPSDEACDFETGVCECYFLACEDACCAENEDCHEGACCVPDCGGRECGSDGCGGVCSPGCSSEETCHEATRTCRAVCVPGCDGGPCAPGEWATICAGTFTMGSPESEEGHDDDETQHEVILTGDFEILSTEVTQDEFEAQMGYNPSYYPLCGGGCPVDSMSWFEAAAYCNSLSEGAGLSQCYDCWMSTGDDPELICVRATNFATPYDCPGYRLPTEAEFEYAARAGTTTATYNGDLDVEPSRYSCDFSRVLDPIAWYCGNSEVEYDGGRSCSFSAGPRRCGPHEVGTREPNDWGLFDMLGNVREWCYDGYQEDLGSGTVTDPVVYWMNIKSEKVSRGGSWSGLHPRAAERAGFRRHFRSSRLGFRPARSSP